VTKTCHGAVGVGVGVEGWGALGHGSVGGGSAGKVGELGGTGMR